jgi:pimeloyl-ACP methyl ester carboxylesterase
MSSQPTATDIALQRRTVAVENRAGPLDLSGANGTLLRGFPYGFDRHGQALLLVHGLASNAGMWRGAARALAAFGHPTVALDLRGHGRSEKPNSGYKFATLSQDLDLVLTQLIAEDGPRWRHPVLVGQSLGGNLALEFAASHPDRLAGVACVDGGFIELRRSFEGWEECARVLVPPDLECLTRADLEAMLRRASPDWPQEGIEGMLDCFYEDGCGWINPHLRRDRHMMLLRELWEHPPSRLYERVRVPVLLLPAEGGGAPPFAREKHADVQLALERLPWPRVRWFAHADHDIHAQYPTELAQAIHDAIADGFLA